jgi:glycosyltransferase involved in cell wall biosynthesis
MREVFVDARMMHSTGIGTYLKNVIFHLKNAPFKIKLIVDPSAPEKTPWLNHFDLISCSFPIYSLEEQLKLPSIISSCDLFWTPHFNIPLFPIRARKRLVTIHDVYHLAFFSTLTSAQKVYAKWVIPNAVKRSAHVITNSHFSVKELMQYTHVEKEKVSVVYLGANHIYFEDKIEACKYRLPEKYILYVGTSKPHKNLQGLLNAFYELKKNGHDDYHLVIAGKDKTFNRLDRKNEFVLFLNDVEDGHMKALYQSAVATVFPSFYEGFGLPPLEAMFCGCPAIVSKAASLPEICGEGAIYIDSSDPQDIAQTMAAVLESRELRDSLIKKGRERSGLFRWEDCAEKHIQIIEKICKRS